jgi:subtilisin family serine protease
MAQKLLKFLVINLIFILTITSSSLTSQAVSNQNEVTRTNSKNENETGLDFDLTKKFQESILPNSLVASLKNPIENINSVLSQAGLNNQVLVEEIKNNSNILSPQTEASSVQDKVFELNFPNNSTNIANANGLSKNQNEEINSDFINTSKIKEKLEQTGKFKSVYFNRKNILFTNDPLYQEQWHLNNTGQGFTGSPQYEAGIAGNDIGFESILTDDTSNSGQDTVTGVVDSGIDYNHPDIENNIWINNGELTTEIIDLYDTNSDNEIESKEILLYFRNQNLDINNDSAINFSDILNIDSPIMDEIDNDNNGFVDDLIGWDFGENDNDPMDENGHGTHVSGIIAAEANNNIGIAGVASNTKILMAKGEDNFENILDSYLIGAMNYHSGKSTVVNLSLGGFELRTYEEYKNDPLYLSFLSAYDAGSTIVVAAGNSSEPASIFSPSTFPEVISVASSNNKGIKSDFSNFGARIDVTAPGENILSLKASAVPSNDPDVYQNDYWIISGTSMASPVIAGMVTLLKSNQSSLTNEQIRFILRNSTFQNGQFSYFLGFGVIKGQGILNLAAPVMPKLDLKNLDSYTEVNKPFEITIDSQPDANIKLEYARITSLPNIQNYIYTTNLNWTVVNTGTQAPYDYTILPENLLDNNIYVYRIEYESNGQKVYDTGEIGVDNIDLILKYEIINGENDFLVKGSFPLNNTTEYNLQMSFYPLDNSGLAQPVTSCANNNNLYCNNPENPILGYINKEQLTSNGIYQIDYTINFLESSITEQYFRNFLVDSNIKSGFPVSTYDKDFENNTIIPTISDIDNNGSKEIITTDAGNDGFDSFGIEETPFKLFVNISDGTNYPNFPVSINIFETDLSNRIVSTGAKPLVIDLENGSKGIFFAIQTVYENINFTNYGSSVFLYGFNTDGNLLPNFPVKAFDYPFSQVSENLNLSSADLDKNDSNELILSTQQGDVAVIKQNGEFQDGWPKSPDVLNNIYDESVSSKLANPPSIGDINKDGFEDIVYSTGRNVFAYNHLGVEIGSYTTPDATKTTTNLILADINNDLRPEIIFAETAFDAISGLPVKSNLQILDNNLSPDPTFDVLKADQGFNQPSTQNASGILGGLSIANLDQDPDLEIAYTISSNMVGVQEDRSQILIKNIDNSDLSGWPKQIPAVQYIDTLVALEFINNPPIISDLNGDGANEIILSDFANIYAWSIDGNNINNFPINLSNQKLNSSSANFPIVTDLENDGKTDLVISFSGNYRFMDFLNQSPTLTGINNDYLDTDPNYIIAYNFDNQFNFEPTEGGWSNLFYDEFNTNSLLTSYNIEITNPVNNNSYKVNNPIQLDYTIDSDDKIVEKVELYINDILVEDNINQDYSWTPTQTGQYNLKLITYIEGESNAIESEIVTIQAINGDAPNISLNIESADNLNSENAVVINANTTDSDGTIKEVMFYINDKLVFTDNSSPYQYSSILSQGSYNTYAIATDSDGNKATSQSLNFIVKGKTVLVRSGGYNSYTNWIILTGFILICSEIISHKQTKQIKKRK